MQKPKFILSRKKVLEQYSKVKSVADIVSYSSETNQDVTKILEKETDSMFSVILSLLRRDKIREHTGKYR